MLTPEMLVSVEKARALLRGAVALTPPVLRQLHAIQEESAGVIEMRDGTSQEYTPLPTYDTPSFNDRLQRKREFREHASLNEDHATLDSGWKSSCASSEDFALTDLQLLLKNFLAPGTPYNSVLLDHGVGVGKTCTAVTIAENYPDKKVLVLTSPGLQLAFKKQVFDMSKLRVRSDGTLDLHARVQCTGTRYIDMIPNVHLLSVTELERRVNTLITKRYTFMGLDRFANIVSDLATDTSSIEKIRSRFSNHVILVDEAHHLRSVQGVDSKRVTTILDMVLRYTERVKLVLMTATPMYNDARDVIDLLNLMLVNDKRRPLKVSEVFDEHGAMTPAGAEVLRTASRGYVTYMPGGSPYSFPKRLSDTDATPSSVLPIIDIFGKPLQKQDRVSRLNLTCTPMSTIQGLAYNEAANDFSKGVSETDGVAETDGMMKQEGDGSESDGDGSEEGEGDGDKNKKRRGRALRVAQHLLNVVFPSIKNDKQKHDWAIGRVGFSECFDRETRGEGSLRVSYKDGVPRFLAKPLLSSYSPKIESIVKSVVACKGISLCYSRFVWSGAVPLAIAFEHAGFSRYGSTNMVTNLPATEIRGRYVIITGSQEVGGDSDAEVTAARAASNMDGGDIKVIIVTSKASEGIDLRFVRQIHVLEPWYNLQKLTQIFGRASRHCSHALLPAPRRNFTLFLHAIRHPKIKGKAKEGERETLDLRAYRISESKQRKIDDVQRVLMSSSFDCALNKGRIDEDDRVRATASTLEDSFGRSRAVSGHKDDGFEGVSGDCDTGIGMGGPTDESTYAPEKHAYGLHAYENVIRQVLRDTVDVSYDVLRERMVDCRDDFMSMVLTRMIEKREPVTDTLGRSCTLRHRDKFYVPEPLDDGSIDVTVRPRRKLVVGVIPKDESSSKGSSDERSKSKSKSKSSRSSKSKLRSSALSPSASALVIERVTAMGLDLKLPPSTEGKLLLQKLNTAMQDAVIDRMSARELQRLCAEVLFVSKPGKMKGNLRNSLAGGGIIVPSSNDDGFYLRDHGGKWLCIAPSDDSTTQDCDAAARVDPAVVERMAMNRAIRTSASAAVVRSSASPSSLPEFRLMTLGSKKQGTICSQTSTHTLEQLKDMCVVSFRAVDKSIPVSPLDGMAKKRLCRVYELGMRLGSEFARPSQMMDH